MPDSMSGKNWKTSSSADCEPSTTRQNKASVDTWCICFICIQIPATKECCRPLAFTSFKAFLKNKRVLELAFLAHIPHDF